MTERTCPGHTCGRPLHDQRTLCPRCQHRLERTIGDLVAETRELDLTITRQARVTGGTRPRTHEPEEDWRGTEHAQPARPLPWNEHAASHGDNALALLYEWADWTAAAHGENGLPVRTSRPATGREPLASQATATLLRHADWICHHDQGPDLATAMWHTRQAIRRLTDRPLERVYAGPCHATLPATITEHDGKITVSLRKSRCELDLYRAWGADTITCDGHNDPDGNPGCGTTHTIDQRRAVWLRTAVEEHWVPLRDLYESLPLLLPGAEIPPWDTVRKWTQWQEKTNAKGHKYRVQPRLQPAGVTLRGQKLYRGRDVLRLVLDTAKRRGRRRTRNRGKVSA